MNLIEQAYVNLFPCKPLTHQTSISYNRRLASFNANIKFSKTKLHLAMHQEWQDIDDQIKIGLAEHLLCKVFKYKAVTYNIQLYKHFLKTLPTITAKKTIEPYLEQSFDRNNVFFAATFQTQIEKTNLKWGQASIRKLAHYNLHTDTIAVSTLFKTAPQEMLDYLMYHEMLHKYHKFKTHGTRDSYHSAEFKQDEQKFPNAKQLEKNIPLFIRKAKKTILVNQPLSVPRQVRLPKNLLDWIKQKM